MSVSRRVQNSIAKMQESDWEDALFSICAALEATAVQELGRRGRTAYKAFIHDNFGLITAVAFGGKRIYHLLLGYDHPDIKKTTEGCCSVEDILYHAVRCGLYHEAKLPGNLTFTKECQIRVNEGKLVLPASLIYGLILAVVVSPANTEESTQEPLLLSLDGLPIPINKLWGKRNELLWLLDVLAAVKNLQMELDGCALTSCQKNAE